MRAGLWHAPLALSLLLPGLPGCSGPKTAEVPVAAADAPSGTSAEQDAALDLSPVAAPEHRVAVASWRTPASSLTTVIDWAGLGIDWRAWLASGPAAPFLPVLDLEAPVDVVATLDPKAKNRPRVFFAVSVGLTSRQAALDLFQRMEMMPEFVEPGVHSVQPSPKTICFVAAALGQAKARLVCSEQRESLDLLSPYLTRGNPSALAGDADLHVELNAEAAFELYGEKAQFLKLGVPMMLGEVSVGNPEFDDALRAAATAFVDELILELGDLKALRLDGWLRTAGTAASAGTAADELELRLGIDFRGSKSWMAQVLTSAEGNANVAPAQYWELPLDANAAFYYASSKPELMQPLLAHLERVVQGGLSHLGASAAVRSEWPATLRALLSVSGPTVSARGPIPQQALPEKRGPRDELRASLGYSIVGVEDPENHYSKFLEETLQLYQDASLRKSLAGQYGLDAAKLPKVQSRRGPARLPASRIYELELPASWIAATRGEAAESAAALEGTIPLAIVASREGQRTWLGASSYLPVLEERLAAMAAPTPPTESLAQRQGLEILRQEKANVAGFWTLAGLQTGMSPGQGELSELLSALGQSEVPIVGRAIANGQGPRSELELHVPAALIRDVATSAISKR